MEHNREVKNELTWKDIPGYEGLYSVSDTGLVRRLSRKIKHPSGSLSVLPEIILVNVLYLLGHYEQVNLYKDGKMKSIKVHRLVAMAFHQNPENKPAVNHIDGNKLNNHALNLEWVTNKENTTHAYKNGLVNTSKGQSHVYAKLTDSDVLSIKSLVSMGELQKDVAIKFGVHKATVNSIIKGKNWKHIK